VVCSGQGLQLFQVPGAQCLVPRAWPGLLAGLKINKQKIKGKQRKEKALDYRFK